jgi:hypothetical protein
MASERNARTIPLSAIDEGVVRQLGDAQALRVLGLTLLRDVRRARNRALGRAADALGPNAAAEEGKAIEAKRGLGALVVDMLQSARARAAQKVPLPRDDRLIVFGLVRDAAGKPLRDVRMTLHDARGRRIDSVKPVPTDGAGGYVLTLPIAKQEPPPKGRGHELEGAGAREAAEVEAPLLIVYVGAQGGKDREPMVFAKPIARVAGTRAAHYVTLEG